MTAISDTINTAATEPASNVQYLWDTFKAGIETSLNKHVPTKFSKRHSTMPWFDRKLKRMTRRKSRLYKHAKKTRQWGAFKQYQRECKKSF